MSHDPGKSNEHFKALIQILYRTLTRPENNIIHQSPFSRASTDEVKEALEHSVHQLLRFFCEADSADRNWLIDTEPFDGVDGRTIGSPEQHFETMYHITYDKTEAAAVGLAIGGDFRPLEALLLERGYLRTARGRALVVAKMRGEKIQRGISKEHNELCDQIIEIMACQTCSATKARKTLLESRDDLTPSKLDTIWKRALQRPEMEMKLALVEALVDNLRKQKGAVPIKSHSLRGVERLDALSKRLGWVQN